MRSNKSEMKRQHQIMIFAVCEFDPINIAFIFDEILLIYANISLLLGFYVFISAFGLKLHFIFVCSIIEELNRKKREEINLRALVFIP